MQFKIIIGIKRFFKISAWIFALILAVFFGFLIIAQSPKVQTYLAKKAVEMFKDKINGDISFEKIHIRPFNAFVLKNVSITDRSPYKNTNDSLSIPVDTLFKAEYIAATFSIKGLFMNKGLHLGLAKIRNGALNITTEPSGDSTIMNLNKIFMFGNSGNSSDADNDIFDISKVEVENFRFTMRNYTSGTEVRNDAINWNDLDINIFDLRGHDIGMKGKVLKGVADMVSLREKSGYTVFKLSGKAKVGNGKALVSDIKLRDLWSDLNLPKINMYYKGNESWSNFIEEVMMDIKLSRSRISLKSLSYFVPTLKDKMLEIEASGTYKGYVNDFKVNGLKISTLDKGISGEINGSVIGLPDSKAMLTDINFNSFRFNTLAIENIISGLVPQSKIKLSSYAPKEELVFDGKISGPLNRLAVSGKLKSPAIGEFAANVDIRNLTDSSRNLNIAGRISTTDLNIGKIISSKSVGECTMFTSLNAEFSKTGQRVKIDTLRMSKLQALGYTYTGISAGGVFENETFNGKIVCSDPNLNFIFQGIITPSRKTKNAVYQFYANLGYADLHALKLDKREESKVSMQTVANFKMIDGNDIIGTIDVKDLVLKDNIGTHNISDISISSHINDDINRVRIKSSFLDGSYIGSGFFNTFVKDLKALTIGSETPALLTKEAEKWSGNKYDVDITIHDSKDVLSFFAPGLYVADSTKLSLKINEQGMLNALLDSKRIAFNDKYLKNISLDINNKDSQLNASISAEQLNISPISTSNNLINLFADDNNLGIGISYNNDTESENRGEVYLKGKLFRDSKDSLFISAESLPSNIYFNSAAWSLNNAKLLLSGNRIAIDNLELKNENQSLVVDGAYSNSKSDTLFMRLDKFDIGIANSFTDKNLDIKGLLSGMAEISVPRKGNMYMAADLQCDSMSIAGEEIGSLKLRSFKDVERNGFNIFIDNTLNSKHNISATAFVSTDNKTAEGEISLDSLDLGYARPFLTDIFSDLDGFLSGRVWFDGSLKKLNINSSDLYLHDGLMKIAFTQVPYTLNGPLSISSDGVVFHDINIKDRFGSAGIVRGGIGWKYFNDINFDTHLRFTQVEALNIPEGGNPVFYGNAFATGRVDITGPMNAILLDINVSTSKDGNFHLPLNNEASAASSDLLTFKEPVLYEKNDSYEELMARLKEVQKPESDFRLKLHLDVNQGTEAFIEIDKASGNVLTGRGNGTIDIELRPLTKLFTLNGDYNILSGNYHLDVLGITSRDFAIQQGSFIRFNGDVMNSDLDINAVYNTKATIGALIADTTATTRRNVECLINISEKLSSPRISFDIKIPDLDPTAKALVDNALNTTDKVQKQFISLLVAGSFLPDEQSGIVNNSNVLNTTVSEIMASQLNAILERFNIPVDLGLDYENKNGSDIFDVALSTQLFNNRVLVNGTIGNRQYGKNTAGENMVGDLEIQVKLDKPGTIRLNLFSHSADQYTSYLDNTQRNGIGITYQKEFNSFKEFFRNLFTSRKKRKEMELNREVEKQTEQKVTVSIKKKDE